jgi:WD40 repeat protein
MRFLSLVLFLMGLCAVGVSAQEPLVWEATATYDHISRIVWNADGTQVAAASFAYDDPTHLQSTIEVWDAVTGELVKTFGTPDSQPISAVFNGDGALLITGLTTGEVAIWNVQDGQIVQRIQAHETPPNVILSPDGQWLVSWESSGVIIWKAAELAPQFILTPTTPDAPLSIFALISPDSTTLALVDTAGVMTLYDLDTGEELSKILTDESIEPYTAAYTPDGLGVALGYQSLVIWNTILRNQTSSMVIGADVYRVAYRNETQIAIADANGIVALWDTSTGLRVQTFAEGLESVGDMAFSPDGSHIAIGGPDGQITVYAVIE